MTVIAEAPTPRNPTDTPSQRSGLRRGLHGGLRRRILLIFTLGSAVLAVLLAGATYALTRSNVVQQTETAGIDATRRNAQTVQNNLRGPAPSAHICYFCNSYRWFNNNSCRWFRN